MSIVQFVLLNLFRRPWVVLLFLLLVVLLVSGIGPITFLIIPSSSKHNNKHASTKELQNNPYNMPTTSNDAIDSTKPLLSFCGNGECDGTETIESCFEDCPGVTTPAMCGEEPHSDPGGEAVAWGMTHKTKSAAECCERCAQHASKNPQKPCVGVVSNLGL